MNKCTHFGAPQTSTLTGDTGDTKHLRASTSPRQCPFCSYPIGKLVSLGEIRVPLRVSVTHLMAIFSSNFKVSFTQFTQLTIAAPSSTSPNVTKLLSYISLFLQGSRSRPSLVTIAEICRQVVSVDSKAARDVHDKVRLELGKLAQREAATLSDQHALGHEAWLDAVNDAATRWSDRTVRLHP
jgi:hypothetical protein